ncbi:MAG TPA: thioesterase family protein [Longimicrobiaceae bacterium]|jgi:acyl-CoA thioester hydrolase|nr:thioesterase family protein [Longimicrobiaceae bacterium]
MNDRETTDVLLAGFPIVVEESVSWAEMDAFRHVNNAVFFRYFEDARVEYLVRIGLGADPGPGGLGPILASTHCRFRRPVVYPDRLRVGARTAEVREDRFVMEYRVVSTAQETVAAEGGAVVVCYDYDSNAKAPLPAAVRRAIAGLEG